MNKDSKIYVAGHTGLVGSAIVRELNRQGYINILTRSRVELNLMNEWDVIDFFAKTAPEFVFLAAARVGGILANRDYPGEFFRQNMQISSNVIDAARMMNAKLLFLGSSCIYPKHCAQPIEEEALLSGPLEESNQWYAIAKIAGIKMCQAYRRQYGSDFICVMPPNLYGPNDHYDLQTCHVLPALIRRFHEAKVAGASEVTCWGTGSPMREFLYVDDLSRALIMLMEQYSDERIINVGNGEEISIRELSETIADVVDYTGTINWDTTKPDGTPRKVMRSDRIHAMGWRAETFLRAGLRLAYEDFLKQQNGVK